MMLVLVSTAPTTHRLIPTANKFYFYIQGRIAFGSFSTQPNASRQRQKSSGGFLLWLTAMFVCGCVNRRDHACSIGRFFCSVRHPFIVAGTTQCLRVYIESPRSGNPASVRCTRIWCVRPVSNAHSIKLKVPPLASTLQWVTARFPPLSVDAQRLRCTGCRAISVSMVPPSL